MIKMTFYRERYHDTPKDVWIYKLYIKNTAHEIVKNPILYQHCPPYIEYIPNSLKVNHRSWEVSEFKQGVQLDAILPGEKIEVTWKSMSLGIHEGRQCDYYMILTFEPEHGGGQGDRINRSNVLAINPKRKKIIEIEHRAKIRESHHQRQLSISIIIRNNSYHTVSDLILIYNLHYKLVMIPETLRLNGKCIKGDLTQLKLPPLGARGKENEQVELTLCARVREEYISEIKNAICCQVRVKYMRGRCEICLISGKAIKLYM